MYDPIKYKPFNMFLEDVQNINSDSLVKLQDYKTKVDKYNTDKAKFKNILTTKKQEEWEKEANKIIAGNQYLGTAWKIAKLQNTVDVMNAKVRSNDLSDQEVREMQDDIKKQSAELAKERLEFQKRLKDDLTSIQKD